MMINNLPNYAKNMEFIVVRECDGEYWFWGGYDKDANRAYQAAEEIGGIVVHNVRV